MGQHLNDQRNTITRRRLLTGLLAATAVGSAAKAAGALDALRVATAPDLLVGTFESMSGDEVSIGTTRGPVPGRFVSSFSIGDIRPGDQVVLEGRWAASVFLATSICRLHQLWQAKVESREQDRLLTDKGTLLLTYDTLAEQSFAGAAQPLHSIAPGDVIAAMGYRSVEQLGLVAVKVSSATKG